ncbi:MAG: SDR family oxidoreductase [Chitinophagaceae bacterium]|nr:SDR family oxidoreductase [Chitinophagaceae bacterium]
MSSIKNKTILITGGASGIGKLMGKLCLQEEAARLIIWDIDRKKTEETVAEFKSIGEVHTYHVDVSNVDEIIMAANDIKQKWGGVDILFNNAGVISGNKNFHQFTHRDIDFTMRINTNALMHVTLEFLPGMIEKKSGHIVNIASAAGLIPNPKLSVYCASKHAVIGWGESMRVELEQISKDLHVTTVTPSYISTGMFEGVRSPMVPIVRPQKAAKAIINGVKKNKIFVRMPWIVYAVPFIKGILPVRWMDFLTGKIFGFHRSMDSFKGRN